jgi:hypothetical protein
MRTRARYIGTSVEGQYRTALVDASGNGWVWAQFNEWGESNLHHGWHRFPQRDFADLEGYDPLPPIPEGPFEEPEPQRGRQVFYGVAMSNRQFDTVQESNARMRRRGPNNPCAEISVGRSGPVVNIPAGWAESMLSAFQTATRTIRYTAQENREMRDLDVTSQQMWEQMWATDEELAS